MTDNVASVVGRPVWVDLGSPDPAASRAFYERVFGWQIAVNPDPRYGGYAIAQLDGRDVAGIGANQAADAPPAWALYIGTDDAGRLAQAVTEAGGIVIAPPFAVGDQGRMAVFQDPVGAFVSAWEPAAMVGFSTGGPGRFAWAELSARGMDRAIRFYGAAFGWTASESPMPEGGPYIQFQMGDEYVAGGTEMDPGVPGETPSYWTVYFAADDIDATFRTALDAGARQVVPPSSFPGGRFAILADPHGAVFGLFAVDDR